MILTVTLNPAVDEEYVVPEFRPGGWFRATKSSRSPGGKGINVSTLLAQFGYTSTAMGFLAGFNGEYIRNALRASRITTDFVHIPVRPGPMCMSSTIRATLKPAFPRPVPPSALRPWTA